MARPKRIWMPGAKYHVTCRGNHRNEIFRDNEDREVYLQIVRQSLSRFRYCLHCFCLMTNHVHLLLETTDVPIWLIMHYINMSFTHYMNDKYELVGHLFQGRYGAEPVHENDVMLFISRYIHLNPVRAGMVANPEDYRWSSYRMFIGQESADLVDPRPLLSQLGADVHFRYLDWCRTCVETEAFRKHLARQQGTRVKQGPGTVNKV